MKIIKTLTTRESIITIFEKDNQKYVKKQFINTLSKNTPHRLDCNVCPCRGPIKGLFHHEVNIIKKLYNSPHFPKIVDIDDDTNTFVMTYCGTPLNKLSEPKYKYIPTDWYQQVQEISSELDKNDIYHNDIALSNVCINNNIIFMIDFVCTRSLGQKPINDRNNINDLTNLFTKKLKCKISYPIIDKTVCNVPKIGLAISTFSEPNTDKERYLIIKQSLDSLQEYLKKTKLNIYVVIVVDGLIPDVHKKLLNNYKFNIENKTENGGVSKVKNTGIRLLLEQKIDLGFLCDDDILYKNDCLEQYINCMTKGKIPHMGYCQMDPIVEPRNTWEKRGYVKVQINNTYVMKHKGRGVGCLLTFTPELIKKIGYFKVLPGKYGYEHINFTYRCIHQKMIPHACDILNALNYIDHIGFKPISEKKFKKNHSISESIRVEENKKNKNVWNLELNKYIELIE